MLLLLGFTSVLFTYPLELIRVRMAFHTHHSQNTSASPIPRISFTSAARLIYREGAGNPSTSAPTTRSLFHAFPLLKFYRGFTVSLVGMVPYAGTSFLAWGYLRSVLLPSPLDGRRRSTPLADLSIGAISGVAAQTVSYPFEVVRRRMQVGGLTSPDRWLSWRETIRTIYARNGLRGFYVGLSIGWVKVVPMNAVSFAVWQGLKRLWDL
jgi:solute carrier family 25 (mitochondrial carrier protein), member 16